VITIGWVSAKIWRGFSDNPEALINAVFLNNGAYFGLRGRQDHVNMTWGDIQLKSTSGGQDHVNITWDDIQLKSTSGGQT
jgi:hypothetical protein